MNQLKINYQGKPAPEIKLETYDIKNEQEFVFRNVKKTSDHLKMILKKGNYVQENIQELNNT